MATSASKVVLADGGINQSPMGKNDTSALVQMILFVILTVGACLGAAFVLLRG